MQDIFQQVTEGFLKYVLCSHNIHFFLYKTQYVLRVCLSVCSKKCLYNKCFFVPQTVRCILLLVFWPLNWHWKPPDSFCLTIKKFSRIGRQCLLSPRARSTHITSEKLPNFFFVFNFRVTSWTLAMMTLEELMQCLRFLYFDLSLPFW